MARVKIAYLTRRRPLRASLRHVADPAAPDCPPVVWRRRGAGRCTRAHSSGLGPDHISAS